jgi:hypothetical protein
MTSKLSSVLPSNSLIDVAVGKPISTVYANNDNILKPLELIAYNNDVTMSFPSKDFGSTSTFMFSRSYQFLKNICVVFEVNITRADTDELYEDYLAYNFIKEIRYKIGGIENFVINTSSFMHIAMAQCENQEKKDKLLDLAGYSMLSTATKGYSGKTKFVAMLPLPWCSLQTKKFNHQDSYPLPLHMLNDPVELNITLRNKSEIAKLTSSANLTIENAYLTFEYGVIASPNQLKNTVYKWPFINNFSYTYNISDNKAEQTINLNSFRKSELRGLSFHYVPKILENHIYSGRKLSDIELLFNGQKIWSAPRNEIYELIYGKSCNNLGRKKIVKAAAKADTFIYKTKSGDDLIDPDAVTDLSTVAEDGDLLVFRGEILSKTDTNIGGKYSDKLYYYIPLSEIKDFSQNFVLGMDANKQSMQLKFIRPDVVSGGRLYVTYHYSNIYQFDGDSAILIS